MSKLIIRYFLVIGLATLLFGCAGAGEEAAQPTSDLEAVAYNIQEVSVAEPEDSVPEVEEGYTIAINYIGWVDGHGHDCENIWEARLYEDGILISEIIVYVECNIIDCELPLRSFDPQTRTGSFGNNHVTYALDFNDHTWELVRHYSLEHLGPPLVYNDEWEIRPAFQGWIDSDIVAVEMASGNTHFLSIGVAIPERFVLTPDNLLLIDGIVLIDVPTAKELGSTIGSSFAGTGSIVQGSAFDSEREWFVLLWRGPDVANIPGYGQQLPVMISVYTREGELVRSFDTGIDGFAILAQNSFVHVGIELDGQGYAGVGGFGTVRYWP